MFKAWPFRKQLMLLSLTAFLAIGTAMLAGGALIYRYELLAEELSRDDLPELGAWTQTLQDVAKIHDNFIALVDNAHPSSDEQVLYLEGRALANRLDGLILQVEARDKGMGTAAQGNPIRQLRDELSGYRASCLTAVEMLTVNPALSATYRVKAALSLNRLNQEMAALLKSKHEMMDNRLLARLQGVEDVAKILGVGLLLLSFFFFVLIARLTRKLSDNFEFISSNLEELGAGRTDIVFDRLVDESEFGRVVAGLGKFQVALTERDLAQRKMQAIFDSILEGVVVIDTAGMIIQTNLALGPMFGYGVDELLGRKVNVLVDTAHASRHDDFLARYLRTAENHIIGTVRTLKARRKSGEEFPIQLAVSQVQVGDITYFVGVIADISDQVEQQENLRKARDQAETANRAKSDFLANMSHEIRTPLNGIIGMTELALDASNDEERLEYIRIVKSSAQTLLFIVNDILDFSKIEAGKLQIEQTGFNVQQLLGDTVASMAPQVKRKGLHVQLDCASDVPGAVIGDPVRLRQVLFNLIGNAIKFTGQGGIEVRVTLASRSEDEATLQLMVRDTGIGIAADKLEHIFDAFSQADASTTRRYGGTGLGLTISRQLVELMGGQMWIDSEVGVGTSLHFTVSVGIDSADAAGAQVTDAPTATQTAVVPSASDPRTTQGGGLSVLVVEDNPVNRQLALIMLEKRGHRVTTAENGELALAQIATGAHYDIVLMDMQMPVLGGLDATRAIRAREEAGRLPRVRIVAMTANAMQGDREACLEAGMDDYLSKPIKAEDLFAKLQRSNPGNTQNNWLS